MSEDRYRGKSLVFGNLLDLHNIEIKAKLEIAAKLLEELKLLERGVFTAFISFVLAEAGYYNKTFAELNPPHEKEKTPFTTEFDDEDWGSEVDQLYVSEEFRRDMSDVEYESLKKSQEWTIRYIGNKNNQVDVKFLSGDPFWYFVEYPLEVPILDEKWVRVPWGNRFLQQRDRTVDNYIVVHPSTYKGGKSRFKELSEWLEKEMGHRILFSVDGFLHQFFPQEEKKDALKMNWAAVREKILKKLRGDYPLLVHATHADSLSEIKQRLFYARLKYDERRLEDAVKDSALVCEGLLRVLHEVCRPEKGRKKLNYYDFLCDLKAIITEKFGENVYKDLDFIRVWRNNVLHSPPKRPDDLTTFQIVGRATIFHELFTKWMKERS